MKFKLIGNNEISSSDIVGGFDKGSAPSNTFIGKNGGVAEDEELLAELMAISAKSQKNRFDDDNNDTDGDSRTPSNANIDLVKDDTSASRQKPIGFPKTESVTEEARIEESNDAEEPIVVSKVGFKSSIPHTFKGQNGGSAEDAELLAELMAVSSRSKSSASQQEDTQSAMVRGGDDTSTANDAQPVDGVASLPPWKKKASRKSTGTGRRKEGGDVPPWKRKEVSASKSDSTSNVIGSQGMTNNVVERPSSSDIVGGFDKGSAPLNTFIGKNGGAAEDAELLAELMAISAKSQKKRSDNIHSDGNDEITKTPDITCNDADNEYGYSDKNVGTGTSIRNMLPSNNLVTTSSVRDTSEIHSLTTDDFVNGVTAKEWKTRKLCFHGLSARIREYSQCNETPFRGEEILPYIDNKVSSFVKDTNASALDASLDLALQYSEFCIGASDFEIANKISQSKSVPFFVHS